MQLTLAPCQRTETVVLAGDGISLGAASHKLVSVQSDRNETQSRGPDGKCSCACSRLFTVTKNLTAAAAELDEECKSAGF